MAAPLVRGERMDFVDDHRARGRQHPASGLRAQQHIQRLRRRGAGKRLREPGLDGRMKQVGGDHLVNIAAGSARYKPAWLDSIERSFDNSTTLASRQITPPVDPQWTFPRLPSSMWKRRV